MAITTPLYEAGNYLARIESQRFVTSPTKGTLGLSLSCLILRNLGQTEMLHDQYQRDAVLWVTDSTWERVQRQLEGLGYSGADLDGVDPDIQGFHSFAGVEVELKRKHKESETKGEVYEQWSLESGNLKLRNRSQLEYFNKLMRKNRKKDGGDGGSALDDGLSDSEFPF
jgi:hypothetical protein